MVIENKRTVIKVQLRKLLFLAMLGFILVAMHYPETFGKFDFGIKQVYLIIGLVAVYLLYYFFGTIRAYHYFYFSDLSPIKLVFRFYSLAPLSKRNNSIEIRKDELQNFLIERKLFGLRSYLILYQKTPKGIAKYNPISISLLNKTQKSELTNSLERFSLSKERIS